MIGNHRLTLGQSRAQMAVWAMIPGPLLMSNDLRAMKPEAKAILLNKRVIAINQDHLGLPGKRIYKVSFVIAELIYIADRNIFFTVSTVLNDVLEPSLIFHKKSNLLTNLNAYYPV